MRHQKRRRLVKLRASEHYGALLRARALDRLGKAAALVLLDRVGKAASGLNCSSGASWIFGRGVQGVNETNERPTTPGLALARGRRMADGADSDTPKATSPKRKTPLQPLPRREQARSVTGGLQGEGVCSAREGAKAHAFECCSPSERVHSIERKLQRQADRGAALGENGSSAPPPSGLLPPASSIRDVPIRLGGPMEKLSVRDQAQWNSLGAKSRAKKKLMLLCRQIMRNVEKIDWKPVGRPTTHEIEDFVRKTCGQLCVCTRCFET